MKKKKRRKAVARRVTKAFLGVVLLSLFFWSAGYAPVYEQDRVLLGVVLMAVGVVGLLAAFLLWYMGYDRLREDLKRDYGTRCFTPPPTMPDIPRDFDGPSANQMEKVGIHNGGERA